MEQALCEGDVEVYCEDIGKSVEVYSREVDECISEVELSNAECEDVVKGMGCVLCLAGRVFLEQGQNLIHFIMGEILPYALL